MTHFVSNLFGSRDSLPRKEFYDALAEKNIPIYFSAGPSEVHYSELSFSIRYSINKRMVSMEFSQIIAISILAAAILMLIATTTAIGMHNLKHGLAFITAPPKTIHLLIGLASLGGLGLMALIISSVAKQNYLNQRLTQKEADLQFQQITAILSKSKDSRFFRLASDLQKL